MQFNDQPLAPWLDKLNSRTPLDIEERAALLSLPYKIAEVDSATCIVREGDIAESCCVLLTGFAFRSRSTVGGARQVLAINMRGDAVDLQNSMMQVADHSVQTLTNAKIASIPRRSILTIIAKYPRVGEALWRQTLVDGSIANEWILNVGRRAGRERICHLMCEFAFLQTAAGLTDGPDYSWPLTQEQVGEATGMTGIHVNRVLQGLRSDGLIAVGKGTLHISNWGALRNAAGFQTAYLHQESLVAA